jgi:hypothetical protein
LDKHPGVKDILMAWRTTSGKALPSKVAKLVIDINFYQ